MKQVLQNLGTGHTEVAEIPCPAARRGHLLIRTDATLVSAGTERMIVEFGKASLVSKVRQRPDAVKQVVDKIRNDGVLAALETVRAKLDHDLPLGYCNVGTVVEIGDGVRGFSIGQRVASNGNHAEIVCVPANLCAPLPESVTGDAAAFTVLGAIALQGVRLIQPTLGETIVVTGLGLVGLLTVQILRAHGCRVLGLDMDEARLELARRFGARTFDLSGGRDPLSVADEFSRGRGVDGVLVAAATASNDPVHQAAQMCRKRGRIVLVGVTGLELRRSDFYEKELTFQVSCSYGPGRYDPGYEERGNDYPVGFVRWTEQRNFEAVLDMLADGRIDTAPLISHRFPIEEAALAYAALVGETPSLGILLEYPSRGIDDLAKRRRTVTVASAPAAATGGHPTVGFIGAGNYAAGVLIPAFADAGAILKTVASRGGLSGAQAARKFGFREATTDIEATLADPDIDTVVIATRHDSHAPLVCSALEAGKHIFVEKPLAIDRAGLAAIEDTYGRLAAEGRAPLLMVGFNRRFAPQIGKLKAALDDTVGPKALVMTVNAGVLAPDHWTRDPATGGGRIVGEGCHFVDLLIHLVGEPVSAVSATALGGPDGGGGRDGASFTLGFADGSMGTVHYLPNGHRGLPKERLEVFCAGRIARLDNFRRLDGFGWPAIRRDRLWRQDKGNRSCVAAFVQALRDGKPAPIPFAELIESCRVTFDVVDAAAR